MVRISAGWEAPSPNIRPQPDLIIRYNGGYQTKSFWPEFENRHLPVFTIALNMSKQAIEINSQPLPKEVAANNSYQEYDYQLLPEFLFQLLGNGRKDIAGLGITPGKLCNIFKQLEGEWSWKGDWKHIPSRRFYL